MDYDADTNTVSIYNTQVPSDLYSVVFQVMDEINLGEINILNEDLKKNDYHPLDRNETPGFLKILVHQLSSDSTYSSNGIPANWEKTADFCSIGILVSLCASAWMGPWKPLSKL